MRLPSSIGKALVFAGLLSFIKAEEEVRIYIRTADVAKLNEGGPFPQNINEIEAFLEAVRTEKEEGAGSGLLKKGQHPTNCNTNNDRQTVYLEFPNRPTFEACLLVNTPSTFDSFIFSEADKQFILERLEADFDGFKIDFTLEEPSGCDYTTLTFSPPEEQITVGATEECNAVLFGRADQIDFRNRDQTDTAFIDTSFWTWILQAPLADPVGIFFRLSGLNPATPIEKALRIATLNQASNTGAHELGHILGLRHYDSLGSQGANNGFISFTILDGIIDLKVADQTGTETLLHLMASGASVNLPSSGSTAQDRFFSERSAIKLLLGTKGNGLSYNEAEAKKLGGSIGATKPGMKLKQLTVPNTIIEGQFAGKNLATSVAVIEAASIETDQEVDQYRFRFEKGQFINAEVISFVSNQPLEDLVITGLSIYHDDGGKLVHLITSYQEFEAYDPLIFDFEIAADGNYVMEVFAQKFVCFGVYCFFLDLGNAIYNTGKYDMLVYSVDRALGPP